MKLQRGPKIKNIVLVTVDCLRHDHSWELDIPFLKTSKSNHFSTAPFTPSGFKGLFFGELSLSGGTGMIPMFSRNCISNRLKEAGFTTIGVYSNPLLAQLLRGTRWDYLKDVFPVSGRKRTNRSAKEKILGKIRNLISAREHRLQQSAYADASKITETATTQLEEHTSGRPVFLWAHYMDAHFPYNLANFDIGDRSWKEVRELYTRYQKLDVRQEDISLLKEIYSSALSYMELNIQELVRNASQFLDDPTVILTSDHGEGFLEHGTISHQPYLYDELLHVPLLSNKELLDNTKLSSHLNLYRNILETSGWSGLYLPKETQLLVDKIGTTAEDAVFASILSDPRNDTGYPRLSIRTRQRRYFVDGDIAGYFDLQHDPEESLAVDCDRGDPMIEMLLDRRRVILKTIEINRNI